MTLKPLVTFALAGAIGLAGLALADDMAGMKMDGDKSPTTMPATMPTTAPATMPMEGMKMDGDMKMGGMKMDGMNMGATTSPATMPAAVDLANTVCPVSGDKVEGSKLTATYDGKIYHFCCSDCPAAFKKDPASFAKKVAADPAKYGVMMKP